MSGPEQLDLLDWLTAQPAEPPLAASALHLYVGLTASPAAPAPVLLTRVDPSCNMRRLSGLALAQSLWGEAGVVCHWGRIGSQGQSRTDWHGSLEVAMAARKRRRGYR
ncbi:WGR domain-containing protein [Rubellimicrobium aerolatum]|uniref:WGR domain-containing protein n=1 Tax=Rubellimicrobium aerolatum TaxID=490979 RepID=A0ABW0SGM5_9RHOB|nr:WGR domain-containing protein [Rubellimicrobium aerolatum]MBP1807664.1 putative DNA-binding WGR domain protein [Rubellimicrobium aerolatum]